MADFWDHAGGALLGLAVGDALGTTVEFKARGTFEPVTDIVGGGPFDLPAGGWTDDTSMAMCLAESLTACGGFDARDQCERYVRWWREGCWSVTGTCFDIGIGTREALGRFEASADPFSGGTGEREAGNGSIMRLAPVPVYFARDFDGAVHHSGESSKTTHALPVCVDACRLLGGMIAAAATGEPKARVLEPLAEATVADLHPEIRAIAEGAWRDKSVDDIRGSGYVVDCLEAALWCFAHTETFEAAVLRAVNLGEDADTTGAVCGQLAGAFYGKAGTPEPWLDRLMMREEIEGMAEALIA